MAAPSKSWVTITDAQVDADSPLDVTLVTALRDDLVHLEEWLGLSYTAAQDHDHDGVNSKSAVLGDGVVTSAKLARIKEHFWHVDYNATTISNVGAPALTTYTYNPFTQVAVLDSQNSWIEFGSVAADGNSVTTYRSTAVITRGAHNPVFISRVKINANKAGRRLWFGFSSDYNVHQGATPNYHLAAFRYDTGADGTAFWRCVSIAGTGASAQVTTTTVAVSVDTMYMLKVYLTATAAYFYIDGTLVATHSTTIPTSTTDLYLVLSCKTLDAAAARTMYFSSVSLIREG